MVKFAGLPVPGATITATLGDKKMVAVTGPDGVYSFPDLADGVWSLQVEMLCFSPLKMEVAVAPNAPSPEWDLKLLPFDEIKAAAPPPAPKAAQPAATVPAATPQADGAQAAGPTPSLVAAQAAPKKGSKAAKAAAAAAATATANARPGFQRADLNASGTPPPAGDQPAAGGVDEATPATNGDALLVNGSVSNGVERRAIGNFRKGPGSGYRGDVSSIMDNSALDARVFSVTGQDIPKSAYNHVRYGFTLGGPLSIPHLFHTNNGNFFLAYQGSRNRNANNAQPSLMPTAAERSGDLSQTLNPLGNPVQFIDPSTGAPFPGNVIPASRISPQAKALLNLYPQPNFTPSARYNYEIPLVGTSDSDGLQTRINKMLNQRNSLNGSLGFQRTGADNPNLFQFVDGTHTQGINLNLSWRHTFNKTLYGTLGAQYSRYSMRLHAVLRRPHQHIGRGGDRRQQSGSGVLGAAQSLFQQRLWGTERRTAELRTQPDQRDFVQRDVAEAAAQHHDGRRHPADPAQPAFAAGPARQFRFHRRRDAAHGQRNARARDRQRLSPIFCWALRTPVRSPSATPTSISARPPTTLISPTIGASSAGFTLNAGARWEYSSPIVEKYGRLVNLDIPAGFGAPAPVLGSNPTGPLTGQQYPSSLVHPDKHAVQPRVALSWRPIFGSSLLIRAGYGMTYNTSVYNTIASQMAQQSPLSKSLSVANSPANPLTLANGFIATPGITPNTFAIDPDFRIGYAQNWQVSAQMDLPAAMVATATYNGIKGTRAVQAFLPNTYPAGAANPCPFVPSGICVHDLERQFDARERAVSVAAAPAQRPDIDGAVHLLEVVRQRGARRPGARQQRDRAELAGPERGTRSFDLRPAAPVQFADAVFVRRGRARRSVAARLEGRGVQGMDADHADQRGQRTSAELRSMV